MVTRDSTEAELVALTDKMGDVMQCKDFLNYQGVDTGVATLHQDNTSTITLVTKGGGKYRNKYLRARRAAAEELVASGDARVSYLPTGGMLADHLTKPLQGKVFRYLTRRITGQ